MDSVVVGVADYGELAALYNPKSVYNHYNTLVINYMGYSLESVYFLTKITLRTVE